MIPNFWSALYTRLTVGTAANAFLTDIGGTAAPRVYHNQAPDGATLPYVIFNWQGGGYQYDSPSIDVNGVLTVMAYSRTGQLQAGSISEAAFALLDRNPLTVSGWTNVGLFGEAPHLSFNGPDESGLTVYSSGDTYRVMLDKS